MRFKPIYTVSYNGVWHNAGEVFEISPADADEMSQHGVILEDSVDSIEISSEIKEANVKNKAPKNKTKDEKGGI